MTKENSAPSRTLADLDRCPKCKSADFSKTVGAYKYYCNQCGYQFMEPLAPEAATKPKMLSEEMNGRMTAELDEILFPEPSEVAPGEAVRPKLGMFAPTYEMLEAQVRELTAWKNSAMGQLGKVDALKAELPAKYLGWDAYEATVEYVRELRSTVERLEGELRYLRLKGPV